MVDYSKWKNIEVSDDEDEVHPNIDTPSLFRWRHQARVERMEEQKIEKDKLEAQKKLTEQKKKEIKAKIASEPAENKDVLKKELDSIEKEAKKLEIEEQNLKKKEQAEPWNVDTISQPAFSKTIINNKPERPNYDDMSEDEKEKHMKQFVKDNEKMMKKYGMLRRFDDSKKFLMDNNFLVCEDTANYLVIWCINLEMEEKHELMTHVAHQCICMQYMLELSKQLKIDCRGCIGPFFERIQVADIEYRRQFEDEIKSFIGRIEKRSKEKIADAIAEQEEKEKQERMGPGGLDPADVFETLPQALKDCFEARDTDMLKKVISELPQEEAKYHMKRCCDSGLWVPQDGDVYDEVEETVEAEPTPEPTPSAFQNLDLD